MASYDSPLSRSVGPARTPVTIKLIACVGAVALLVAGPVVAPRVVAMSYGASIGFDAVWLGGVTLAVGLATRSRRDLRRALRVVMLLTCAAFAGVFAWSSLHTTTAHERVVTGGRAGAGAGGNVQLASASFSGLEVSASGTAAVVRLGSGAQKLTLTRFSVGRGPDLRVYLATGSGKHLGSFKDLGALKAERGDQQYAIPAGLDTRRYSTVVIYCRAFASPFAQARLRAG